MIGFKNKRTATQQSDLAAFLDRSTAPIGALTLQGADLGAMIAAETDRKVLEAALDRARKAPDPHWMLALLRRLTDQGNDPEHITEYADVLSASRHFDEARRMLARAGRSARTLPRYDSACMRVAAAAGDHDRAARALEGKGLADHRQATAMLWAELAEIARGQGELEAAAAALTRAEGHLGQGSPHLNEARLDLLALTDGPVAVLDRLQSLSDLPGLAEDPARRHRIEARMLCYEARFAEALERTAAWLTERPDNIALYSLAFQAAANADRASAFTRIIERAHRLFPAWTEVLRLRCAWALEQDETDIALGLMDEIRLRSEWGYLEARLNYACHDPSRNDARAAFRACKDAGLNHGWNEVVLANFLYYFNASPDTLAEARALIEPCIGRLRHDPLALRSHLRLILATEGVDAMADAFEDVPPGLANCGALDPTRLMITAHREDDAAARQGWGRHLARSAHVALNAGSSYPETLSLKYREAAGDVLAFATIFNGIEYVNWFLDYYRSLGVAHFFFTDNGSDDGTTELLMAQPDVSVFQNTGSFSEAGCGVFWANHLMRRFGAGHWCFHLDMDEAFVFPGQEAGRSLGDLLAYMDASGFETLNAPMIDIYPATLTGGVQDNPFDLSCYIDSDYFSFACDTPPYVLTQGGLRARFTGRSLMMNKAPLVKMAPDVAFILNNHHHTHLPVADISGAVLHYKFVGDILSRIDEAIEREEHFMGARFYRALRTPLATASHSESALLSDYSVKYENPAQLVALGLIETSANWQRFQGTGQG